MRRTAAISATITPSNASSGVDVSTDATTARAATNSVSRSATENPPTPVRIETTKTVEKPAAEPAASQAPGPASPANWDIAAMIESVEKTNHDARCGRVEPRRMSRR